MKSFKIMISALSITILIASHAYAHLISDGESLTVSYDFSSEPLSPPWNGFGLSFNYTANATAPPDALLTTATYDMTGFSSSAGSIALLSSVTYPYSSSFSSSAIGLPSTIISNETTWYTTFTAAIGDWDITDIQLQLAQSTWDSPQQVSYSAEWTSKITGTPVPEPATIMLFGLGLLGIARAGRKKKQIMKIFSI